MTGAGGHRFLLLYGSQTGQAKAICEEIAERAPEHGLHADLHCLSQTEKKFCLEREKLVVVVISTTGDGEVPETAHKFWRRLKKTTLPRTHFKNLEYSLLGLGDSNYTNFCNCGKMVDKRLMDLGAQQFYPSAWADDAVGLDVVADPWIEGLFPSLVEKLGANSCQPTSPNGANIVNGNDHESEVNDTNITNSNNLDSSNTDSSIVTNSSADSSNIDNLTTKIKDSELSKSQKSPSIEGGDEQSNSVRNSQNLETETQIKSSKMSTSENLPEMTPSLRHSVPPLSESALSLPVLPPPFLRITYKPDEAFDSSSIPLRNGISFPSAKTDVSYSTLIKATRLTSEEAAKKALLLELNIEGSGWTYEPGDSFGILCPNSSEEVDCLLERLGVTRESDVLYQLDIIEGTKKRNASVPNHIPEVATLRYVLTNCCDIRTAPKKAFVRVLVEYATDPAEKRRLQELASKQGAADYSKFVREEQVSVLDILLAFPSCRPPVERVLEQLPLLQPRAYSACSSPKATPGAVSFVFNVVEFPNVKIRDKVRRGVCTGWLDDLSRSLLQDNDLEDKVAAMNIEDFEIPVYLRGNQYFHAPNDLSVPMVMIGPGTGVAPFIGFLQERAHKIKEAGDTTEVGQTWLFFGCRNQSHDYLFRKELEEFQSSGTLTNLLVSFSRDTQEGSTSPRYVQHNLKEHGKEIYELIAEKNAQIYVCGDAKNMAKGVMAAFSEIYQQHKGLSAKEAEAEVMQLKLKRRYLEDVWA